MPHKPYMPFYTTDYMNDTAHLTMAEHGAYLLLIIHYWHTEKPLPNDDKKLAQICRTTLKGFRQIKSTVSLLFTRRGNTLVHKRIEKEIKEYYEKLDAKRVSGKLGAEKRWNNLDGRPIADPWQTHSGPIVSPMAKNSYTDTNTNTEAYGSKEFKNCGKAVVVATTTSAGADAPAFDVIAADFQNVKNYFLEESPAFFPDIPTTLKFWSSPKLRGMLSVWTREGVTLEDVQAAVTHQRAKDDFKENPYYYANAAIEFARERKKFGKYQTRGAKSKLDKKREEADRNVEIALQQARERGEIE